LNCFYLGLFTRISVLVYPPWFINQYLWLWRRVLRLISSHLFVQNTGFNKVHWLFFKKKSIDNTHQQKY
jgi:hypothetical protein